MLTSAETNISNRPTIQSLDALGSPKSSLAIPTLKDLKDLLLQPIEPAEKWDQSKVITMEDIVSASYLAIPDQSLIVMRKKFTYCSL